MSSSPSPANSTWVLLLAGQPMARHGTERECALAPRDAALLAWLALEGPTLRHRLAALLWPESPAEAARNVLRQRVFQLKKQLGAELIVVERTTLALHPQVQHDLAQSDEVLGPLGPEFAGEFSQWLDQQRQQRLHRRSAALAAAADRAEAAADWQAALAIARQLVALNPLSEAAHRRLIQLHYLAGDRAAALLAFDTCEQRLKDDIGTRPSAETLALLETIERAHAGAVRTTTAGQRVPASVLRPPRLVGRDHEWSQLLQAWAEKRPLTVAGEAGTGKSRLLADLAATRGSTALHVCARPGDDAVPHALTARLARMALSQGESPATLRHPRELARILPELGAAPVAAANSALALHECLLSLLGQAQGRGVAGVLLDDVHFADAASLEALRAVIVSSPDLAWTVAYRPNQLSGAGHELVTAMQQNPQTRALHLAPLDETAVAELVACLALGGHSDELLAKALMRRTGGNPMFVLETLKAALQQGLPLREPLPTAPGVVQLIAKRLSGLGSQALKIARCAAIAGQDFSPALATDVLAAAGPLDLADGWAELESAQLLHDGAFAHDLIQEAALNTVPSSLARHLHTLIARHLVARSASAPRIACHWDASESPIEAVPFLLESGRQAALALRVAEARQAFTRASQLLAAHGRQDEAFGALMALLDQLFNPADDVVDQILRQLEQLAHTTEQLARVAERRADILARQGDFAGSGRVAAQALLSLDSNSHPALAAQLLCKSATADLASGDHDAAIERMHRASEMAARSGDKEAISTTASYFGSVLDHSHRYAEAYLAHRRALDLARERQAPIELISVAANIAGNRAQLGMFDAALEMVDLAYRTAGANTIDLDSQWPSLRAHEGLALRGSGQYRRAIRALEDAQTVIGRYMPGWLSGVHNMQAVLWMELGQMARAMQSAKSALEVAAPGISRYRTRSLLLIADICQRSPQPISHALAAEIKIATEDTSPLSSHQSGLVRVGALPLPQGYELALQLRAQALTHQMPNQVLEAEVRCATAAHHLGEHESASAHARAALQRMRETLPTTMYRGEVWLVAAQALATAAPQEGRQVLREAEQWIRRTAHDCVPEEFRESFLERNPTNRELLLLASHLMH